ncbi:MAG: 3-hydroxyacyl-CoA dehydrogenase family protein [Candidatus Aenigmarchaeota archaeon]|nr:3-hydroxyacyl-CoA dehydrogenase family protein [Candidatus Aenigmarchaeota archaeon]
MFECSNCHRKWNHEIKECIYCDGNIVENKLSDFKVLYSSEVLSGSKKHNAPYFLLLADNGNEKKLIKRGSDVARGTHIIQDYHHNENIIVGVIGSGKMGIGIAALLIDNWFKTIVKTRDNNKKDTIRESLYSILSKSNDHDNTGKKIQLLKITTDFNDLAPCGLVIECVSEDKEIKRKVLEKVSQTTQCTIASNTSSIPISYLSPKGAENRTIGLHFFNPVNKMKLVEVVKTDSTPDRLIKDALYFCERLGKKPIVVHDSPGFIVNRLLMVQLKEAIKMVEEGIASKEEIDEAIKLGLNHVMGPFQIISLIGEDVVKDILETLDTQRLEE